VEDALAMISKTFSVRSVREVRSETKDMKAEVKAFQINESENDGQ
jgi:hypothetical protein